MKKNDVIVFIILCTLALAQTVVACVDLILWVKIILAICLFAGFLVILILKTKDIIKTIKDANRQAQKEGLTTNTLSMLDMYAILKIAPQYNADGTLKDIYQLLNLEPQYDENGNRILTIYEKLGINPRVDKNGNEIPHVVVIKNRVNAIIKLKAAPLPLTYISREELIAGKYPLPPIPPVVGEKEQPPLASIKGLPVVKMPPKPVNTPKPKPSKPNLPSKSAPIKISDQKIKYKSVSEVGASSSLFGIVKPAKKVGTDNSVKPNNAQNNNDGDKKSRVEKVTIDKSTPEKNYHKENPVDINKKDKGVTPTEEMIIF